MGGEQLDYEEKRITRMISQGFEQCSANLLTYWLCFARSFVCIVQEFPDCIMLKRQFNMSYGKQRSTHALRDGCSFTSSVRFNGKFIGARACVFWPAAW
jgi:hypothetical protein